MDDELLRKEFSSFLKRLIDGDCNESDWSKYIVNHYHNESVEEARRQCAQLIIKENPSGDFSDLNESLVKKLELIRVRLD